MSEFEYEVAISFLSEDEGVATRLADLLRERMRVFVYSEQQKQLAGKDGIEKFSSIFKQTARVCVVLYREGWGETKWTRIEESAIKDRAWEKGWAFLLVVALDPSQGRAAPVWLPKVNLWMDYRRYGIEGAAAVIEQKVREEGGEPKEETARERGARLQREADAESDRAAFLNSERGVKAAQVEVIKLFARLDSETVAMRAANAPAEIQCESQELRCVVRMPTASVTIAWDGWYANTLRNAGLRVREFNRPVFFEGYYRGYGRKDPVGEAVFTFTRTLDGRLGWISDSDSGRVWATEQLAEHVLKRVLDRAHTPRTEDDEEEEE